MSNLIREEFPGNSQKTKQLEAKAEILKQKVEKIIQGKVVQRKKSWGKKMSEQILGDDSRSLTSYIFADTIGPALRGMFSDILHGITDVIFGDLRRGINKALGSGGRGYVNYQGISTQNRNIGIPSPRSSSSNRSNHNFDDIILDSRGEAEDVISHLADLTVEYNMASVADLYDLVGVPSNFVDNKWGWTDLTSAKAVRLRGGQGYLLDLPKPVVLD